MSESAPPAGTPPPETPPDSAPWGLTGACLVVLIAFGGQLALGLILGGLASVTLVIMHPDLGSHPEELRDLALMVSIVPLAVASSLLTLGLVYGSVVLACRRPFLESLRLRRPSRAGLTRFVCLGALLAMVYVALAGFFPPSEPQKLGGPLTRLAESGPVGHALWALLALVVPAVEEVLFRGYAYLGARRALGPVGAGVAVSIVFTLLHTAETGAYWPALAGIAALAAILVVLVERTGNLTYCIACHLGYNAALASLSLIGDI